MKLYRGSPNDRNWQVYVQDIDEKVTSIPRPLRQRQDLANHSPDGFAWGYGGSGPAQLALALLADAWGDDRRALRAYQTFKWMLVSVIPQGLPWVISDTIVCALGKQCERQKQDADEEQERLEREAAEAVNKSGAPGA
jgi:hypothetical protein